MGTGWYRIWEHRSVCSSTSELKMKPLEPIPIVTDPALWCYWCNCVSTQTSTDRVTQAHGTTTSHFLPWTEMQTMCSEPSQPGLLILFFQAPPYQAMAAHSWSQGTYHNVIHWLSADVLGLLWLVILGWNSIFRKPPTKPSCDGTWNREFTRLLRCATSKFYI